MEITSLSVSLFILRISSNIIFDCVALPPPLLIFMIIAEVLAFLLACFRRGTILSALA